MEGVASAGGVREGHAPVSVEVDASPAVPSQPERNLLAAVLALALQDAEGPPWTRGFKRRRETAQAWIRSNDRSWAFAFVYICETLGFPPEAVRRATMARWK